MSTLIIFTRLSALYLAVEKPKLLYKLFLLITSHHVELRILNLDRQKCVQYTNFAEIYLSQDSDWPFMIETAAIELEYAY